MERIIISFASTLSIVPSHGETTAALESNATFPSIPVPTIGGSGLSKGTDCRIILDPINARFASSFSKNGMRAADTLTIWFGDISL